MAVIPEILEAYMRVLEGEFFFPFFVYFIAIALGTMYEFLFVFGFFHIGVSFLLAVAHMKENRKLKIIGKLANVFFTVAAFINIFSNDMYFEDFSISAA